MRNERGMTLIEVIVSMTIVFIVFLGLSSAGIVVMDQNIRNTQRDEAVSVAEAEIQAIRSTPFDNVDDLSATPFTVARQIRGISKNYTVQRTVNSLDSPANRNLQVTVDVSWIRQEYGQTRTYNHTVRTIVRAR